MKILPIYNRLIIEGVEKFKGFEFVEDYYDYHDGQSDIKIDMFKDGKKVAYANYAKFQDKFYINFIESLDRGKGYGVILMEYLAKLYGYENLERTSLTPDGVKMRAKLDKHFNFDYDKYKQSQSKHLDPSVLNEIPNPIIKEFLMDMVKIGYEKTWEKWISNNDFKNLHNQLSNKYDLDFNDISYISDWIRGSVTNNNLPEDEPGEYIFKDLNTIKNIK